MRCASSCNPSLTFCRVQLFCYVSLGHSTVSTKFRMNIWGKSDYSTISIIYSWVLTTLCTLGPDLFVGFYIPIFFFNPFIMIFGWIVHMNSIKFTFHLVLGSPIPILALSGNLILWHIVSLWFNVVKSLNITLVGVPSFSVGAGLDYFASSYLKFCKCRIF